MVTDRAAVRESWSAQPITRDVLLEKYAQPGETTVEQIHWRVAHALAAVEAPGRRAHWQARFERALLDGFIPAGRIQAAAGTQRSLTWVNCFVQPMPSSEPDAESMLETALQEAAETLRRGGGVGYDFSPLPPTGARVQEVGHLARGPVACLHLFDHLGTRIEAADARRGAQMGILRCDHPDIEDFIHAKDGGNLRNFNLSVACTDVFMAAVQADQAWPLTHVAEPGTPWLERGAYQRTDGLWVYRTVAARALFDSLMRSTHDHAEPGVFFVDTVNRDNNLSYCETIAACNPCGEQPLPPHGCCDLGSINLCRLVLDPFTDRARFAFEHLARLVPVAVRMLDNVLDATPWPLPQQALEARAKRRIGLGFTGLGDALIMLGLRYDSEAARQTAAQIARVMRDAAYAASVDLAEERGPFEAFRADAYLTAPHCAARLSETLKQRIRVQGLRNSHLLSIAPTGTISLAFADNVSNGIEPAFDWVYTRHRRMARGGMARYRVADHAWRLFRALHDLGEDVAQRPADAMLTPAFVSAMAISAEDQLKMCAAVQPYVDGGISKTVHVAADCPYAAFQNIYLQAWRLGLKGVTTYRPNPLSGAILEAGSLNCP